MGQFRRGIWAGAPLLALLALVLFLGVAKASVGDRLPEFNDCVQVCRELQHVHAIGSC